MELPLLLPLLTVLLFGLSFLSGMLGLGVAFIAIPVLGLFGYDLVDVIQPWALLLNGLTAISAAIALWRRGMVDKRGALVLVIVATIGAPVGVWLLQLASAELVSWLYVAVLVFLAVWMRMPTLTLVGYSARLAAATNSVAVTVPSFSAFLSHLCTASFDWPTVIVTLDRRSHRVVARCPLHAGKVKSATLSRIFAVALIALAVQRAWILLA